jgi:hypothetical protein
MIRTCCMLSLQVLLFAALAGSPVARAQGDGPEGDKSDSIAKQLRELQRSIDEMKGSLGTGNLAVQKLLSDISKMQRQLADLQRDVDALRGKGISTSGASPLGAAVGTVRLVNEYPEPMDFIVNQTLYRVRPGETRELSNLPLGSFTFRVLDVPGYATPQTRVLTDEKPYTIRVHPAR